MILHKNFVFIHIPKTAGEAIVSAISSMKSQNNIVVPTAQNKMFKHQTAMDFF